MISLWLFTLIHILLTDRNRQTVHIQRAKRCMTARFHPLVHILKFTALVVARGAEAKILEPDKITGTDGMVGLCLRATPCYDMQERNQDPLVLGIGEDPLPYR